MEKVKGGLRKRGNNYVIDSKGNRLLVQVETGLKRKSTQ